MPEPRLIQSALDRELARDLRRSVLCGELNWDREAVDDGGDETASIALLFDGVKPVATGRLIRRAQRHWVDLVAVLPRERRRGRGAAVVALLTALAKSESAQALWVLAPLECASFFRACGFEGDSAGDPIQVLHKNLE